jgi:ligand-binding sensor domain-containing protein
LSGPKIVGVEAPDEVAITYTENSFYWPRFEAGPDGKIWLVTGKQVWSFSKDLKQPTQYNLSKILGESCINCEVHEVFFDREGSMWWGTDRGLFQLRESPVLYDATLRQFGDKLTGVREIVVDGNLVWLARQEGLFIWDRTTNLPPRKVDEAYFQALHLGEDGMIYGVEQNRLVRFDPATGARDNSFQPTGNLPEGSCWRIVADRSGRIWIAKWNSIAVYDPDSNELSDFKVAKNGQEVNPGILDWTAYSLAWMLT